MDENPTQPEGPPQEEREASSSDTLNLALTGSLPCIDCGYELQGLTVKGNCPECGRPVRVTLMWAVDPEAEAFQLVKRPLLLGSGVLAVTVCPLITVLLLWYYFGIEYIVNIRQSNFVAAFDGFISELSIGIWFIQLLALTPLIVSRPLRFGGLLSSFGAVCATTMLLFGVLASVGVKTWPRTTNHDILMFVSFSFALYVFSIRALLMPFIHRSKLLRTGHIPRQHISTISIAFAVAGVAHLVAVFSNSSVELVAKITAIAAWSLATLGLMGLVRDAFIVRHTLLHPPRTLEELTRRSVATNEPRP
ncbi:MAG: hypothetical protein AAGB34_00695 [Planctomycetota bacterium]